MERMNRILLILLALGAGAAGFKVFQRSAAAARTTTALRQQAWQASTNELVRTQAVLAALRQEVQEKQARLRAAGPPPGLNLELLGLVEGDRAEGPAVAWAQLRQQLGLGWNSSPDYVLVSKRVLKELDFPRLASATRVTGSAADLLALTPAERTALRAALQQLPEAQGVHIQRAEPNGDILAQYTAAPPEAVAQQSLSNTLALAIAGVVGAERTAVLLPQGWRELTSKLWPSEAETMTIRRSTNGGEPDLVCEMRRGDNVRSSPVRYANYPSSWFLTLCPGGWEDLARRESFELPPTFRKQ
jgi:hypothetical protein